MATSANRFRDDRPSEPGHTYHNSNVLRLFTKGLERRREAQLLDVGPVCDNNINFFAQRVKKLFVCDMFLQFDRARRKGIPSNSVWQHLDFPPESFDGILLWELIDRLDDRDVEVGVELCHKMIRPGGMLVLFVPAEQQVRPGVYSFIVEKGFRLRLRNQPHLDLPAHRRQSRDMLAILAPFTQVRSFIYRNGYKEFLFQRK